MCGVCGVVNYQDKAPVQRELVAEMTLTMEHRGPDDSGIYMDRYVGLGHRRLSIIDLGGGHQPMSDAGESVWIVYNGEIYNHLELRKELEATGHTFRTDCDTEVIIEGYKESRMYDVMEHGSAETLLSEQRRFASSPIDISA